MSENEKSASWRRASGRHEQAAGGRRADQLQPVSSTWRSETSRVPGAPEQLVQAAGISAGHVAPAARQIAGTRRQ
ncbi:MAG TPA: hypothetical protein VMD59_03675 [Acidimicrobiales bacterium]|nr:hypothetical protein [Acidimicrobiales bacterium]